MEVVEAPELRALVFRRFEQRSAENRKPGIHASDLDLCLGKAYYKKTAPLPVGESLLVKFMLGYAFQYYILGEAEEVGEKDGIIFSVDAPFADAKAFVEFKSTAMWYETKARGRFSPEQMEHWVRRAKLYCYARGALFCGIVVVFYAQRVPDLKAWWLTFTKAELDAAWAEAQDRKGVLEKALELGEYPGTDFHAPWECELCENNVPSRCFGTRASAPPRKERES